MTLAFVLINTELGAEEEVKKKLKEIPEVKEIHRVYGVYDAVVKIEAENMEKVRELITRRIRKMEKVRSTLTMIVVE